MTDINPVPHHFAGNKAKREGRHLDAAYEYGTASLILAGWAIFLLTLSIVFRIIGMVA